MRSIAIALPYAVSIRDFVHSGVLNELLYIKDVNFNIYTQNPDLSDFSSVKSERIKVHFIGTYAPSRIEILLRKIYPLLFFDHFVYLQIELSNLPFKRFLAGGFVLLRRLVGTRRMLSFYTHLLRISAGRPGTSTINGQPDLIIATRSTINSLDYGILLEAHRKKIPQLTLAGSWDNFTTKGFFPFPVVKTVVWNRKMANELNEIYAVKEDQIAVAGYPRLRMLHDTGIFHDAASYLESIGLSKYRRFVLYSASYAELTKEVGCSEPREYVVVREIISALEPKLPHDCCILVRLHPFSTDDDQSFFANEPRTHVFVPGRKDKYVERVMSATDECHLAAQIQFAEAIVSMASTITIDALAVNRPVINVDFEPRSRDGLLIRHYYHFNHFRDLLDTVHPPMARNVLEVVAFVERCVAGDKSLEIDHNAFERLYVPRNSENYPQIVRKTIEEILVG